MTASKLHILHTNDIHSHFHQMPYIAGGIRKLKQESQAQGEFVVTVDLGDHADRMNPITEGTWGRANIEIMNATGYQFASVGNNEGLTFPKDIFLSFYDEAKFQVICANLIDSETNQLPRLMKPYFIQQVGPLRVCWISVTAPFPVYDLLGWIVMDPISTVQEIVTDVRDQVDLVVLLSHTGLRMDHQFAQEVKGIDIILGAHTHDLLETGIHVEDTFIIQTGKFGQYLGQTTVEFDTQTKGIISIKGTCHPTQSFPAAPDIVELIAQQERAASEVLSPAITFLEHDFNISWVEESPLGNLLAEGIRDWVGSEVAMVNAGTLLFSLSRGSVTRKDLLALCPHPINPCKISIKGKFLRNILEEALTDESIHREIRGLGFRGKVMGWMCVDGMSLRYDKRRAEGERIESILVQDQPLEEDRIYSIGTLDMFTFGFIFPLFRKAEKIDYFLPEFIRDVLEKELQSTDALARSSKTRWIHV
ncbi:bifunctional UDP-sugar hydrolase/5'-nucleotidase [Ammoniphilus sp. CFH 90114]|uniref:bifunctional metallophosphatase/5'-nucleotidase n=1 Tax=Ammoniphilus sp. CFH 90114 TaxID=2493665 RepID=UPI00101006AF|nr:bifunctional UDP-sugar hydrolase/5'-nucleotidase [Ammoniphilus sp. CFH 90114]RXT05724.1 bifunctional metallophosphatase/5'-nucleotidase [Ammoniphilus sp. CFH 90114]